MKQNFNARPLATLVVALGLGIGANLAGAQAATPAPASGQPMMHHHMGHMGHMGPVGHHGGTRGLTRLHDELKLDARQQALWTEAANAAREAHGAMRERLRTARAETLAALNQPGADLRAIVKRMEDARGEARTQHEATQERWLAVYDALSPEQKEKARVFVKAMFERGERRGMRGQSGPR